MTCESSRVADLSLTVARRLKSAVRVASNYVSARASPGGGFCFYRGHYLEEPNLSDTWHGVSAWKLLTSEPLPDQANHADFVISQAVESQAFALYHRVRCLQLLEAGDPDALKVRDAAAALPLILPRTDTVTLQASLHALFYSLWLRRHLGVATERDRDLGRALHGHQNPDGGYGRPSNLRDTVEALRVLQVCDRPLQTKTAVFVQHMAVPGSGFRLTATSMSPCLETTCAGMACSADLGIEVEYASDAIRFILACQCGNGGFAFRPGGLPDLAWTHLALETLHRRLQVPTLIESVVAIEEK
ncbi:MAG: prenyltransferase/squalene oxidase repeat-containing protein [Burkholderiaceae bacterium]